MAGEGFDPTAALERINSKFAELHSDWNDKWKPGAVLGGTAAAAPLPAAMSKWVELVRDWIGEVMAIHVASGLVFSDEEQKQWKALKKEEGGIIIELLGEHLSVVNMVSSFEQHAKEAVDVMNITNQIANMLDVAEEKTS